MRFSRTPLEEQVKTLHSAAEEREAMRRAEKEGLQYVSTRGLPISAQDVAEIPEEDAHEAEAAVIKKDRNFMALAVFSLNNQKTKELIEKIKAQGIKVSVSIVSWSGLQQIWRRYRAIAEEKDTKEQRGGIVSEARISAEDIKKASESAGTLSGAKTFLGGLAGDTTQIFIKIITSALALGASDVHLENTTKKDALVRFRIDGLLYDVAKAPYGIIHKISSRVKLLSNLKLNITESPQDGRFTISAPDGDIEVRVSVIPAEFGEAVVMRVLDPDAIGVDFAQLGLRKDDEAVISGELKRPNGMILVTGPTGSGKTTTLYAFLKEKQDPSLKIITIEDPIEYHIEGIEQTQVDEGEGYTFAAGLRSVMRQDPDIILVGEIRDLETAETSIHAALTGHLVFSTLHTTSAPGAIPRLVDMGVKPAVMGPAISSIVAQRLVRRLCDKCKKEEDVSDEMRSRIEKLINAIPKPELRETTDIKLYSPVGCAQCIEGFKGRIGIFEILKITDAEEILIKKESTEAEIRRHAREKQGMIYMQEDGILKAIRGITTMEEVERVTGEIEW